MCLLIYYKDYGKCLLLNAVIINVLLTVHFSPNEIIDRMKSCRYYSKGFLKIFVKVENFPIDFTNGITDGNIKKLIFNCSSIIPVAGSSVAPQRRLATTKAFCCASSARCVCVLERVFGFNHKIMINVQESPPSIMVTRNLWSARV
jgi:hypothetical protein